jgi:hypothetical protein
MQVICLHSSKPPSRGCFLMEPVGETIFMIQLWRRRRRRGRGRGLRHWLWLLLLIFFVSCTLYVAAPALLIIPTMQGKHFSYRFTQLLLVFHWYAMTIKFLRYFKLDGSRHGLVCLIVIRMKQPIAHSVGNSRRIYSCVCHGLNLLYYKCPAIP